MIEKTFKHTVNQIRKDRFKYECEKLAKDLGIEIKMTYDGLEWWVFSNGYRFLITIKGNSEKISKFVEQFNG